MNSVGIDLHRKRSHVAVIDEHGKRRDPLPDATGQGAPTRATDGRELD